MINRTLLLVLAFAASACSVDARLNAPPENPPPATILLKDVVASSLPSPLYHFEYDASGRAYSYRNPIRADRPGAVTASISASTSAMPTTTGTGR